MLEYSQYLREAGHEVSVLTLKPEGELANVFKNVTKVPSFKRAHIPPCDLIVATKPEDVLAGWRSKRGKVVHFCQGLELIDLEQRISGAVIPERYKGKGFRAKLTLFRKKISWRIRHFKTERIYRLPTHLVTVAAPLHSELSRRYKRPVELCLNGIRADSFRPAEKFREPPFTNEHPLRIVNVGPLDVTFKGIRTTLAAFAELKAQGAPVRLLRISPKLLPGEREACPMVDEWHEKLPQEKFAALLRSCNAYISNSTEGEGFGLPALEAMSTGLVCILSDIGSYRSFGDPKDYAVFVPEFDASASTSAILELLKAPADRWNGLRARAIEVAKGYSFGDACKKFEAILRTLVPPSVS